MIGLADVRLGNEVLLRSRRQLLSGVRVGIVTNHTGVNSRLESIIDLLAADPGADATDLLPDAGEAWRLPPALAALPPRPLYGRAPDAKLP